MIRNPAAPRLSVPVSERDHILGPTTAPVTVVEYGDYECPICGQAHPVVKQLRRLLGRHLCFVFRHFPLATVHPHAHHAAEAAEAAGAQGEFWAMHDMLFAHQQALADDDLVQYAVAADKSMLTVTHNEEHDRPSSKCFAFVQSYDTNPKCQLFEVLKSQGIQMDQQLTFLSDG